MNRRPLRPSERRYARLLAKRTPLSPADAKTAVRQFGRKAREVVEAAALRNLRPESFPLVNPFPFPEGAIVKLTGADRDANGFYRIRTTS